MRCSGILWFAFCVETSFVTDADAVAVVVRPLIAEAPLSSYQGINTPSIEKILVDIVSDKEFDYAGGAELYHIYTNAIESVDVNQKKLLRYASRRNRKERIEQILNSINQ